MKGDPAVPRQEPVSFVGVSSPSKNPTVLPIFLIEIVGKDGISWRFTVSLIKEELTLNG